MLIKNKIPSPAEIQKEITEFLKQKYGDRIVVPQPEVDKPPEGGPETGKQSPQINFDLKPEELEAFLKQYVVDQDEAIEILATKICTHFNRMKLETAPGGEGELVGNIKSNVLMIGPTGVGKTYLIKLIAQKIGVPFVKGDATKFSETGYVGGDVEDLVRDLVKEAKGDIKLAEYGIIYLDEIDKIAASNHTYGPDVSRTGVQRNLLKLMEESEVDLRTPHDLAAQMEAAMEAQRTGKVTRKKINTKNILFVVSGAFFGLEEIIKKRLNRQSMGFGADVSTKRYVENTDYLAYVKTEDLIQYGFESEFVGRLPVIVRLKDLDVHSMFKILKNPNSTVILGKKRDFRAYGIEIDFEDEALRLIAEKAYQERTGARGLVSVCEKILLKYEKKLPSTQIKRFTVTAEVVREPEKQLQELLDREAMKQFQKKFLAATGIVLSFTPEARRILSEKAQQEKTDFRGLCQKLFKDYEYGLRLLNISEFTIDEKIVENPKDRLEELIKNSYKNR